jgi:hypothetical protein
MVLLAKVPFSIPQLFNIPGLISYWPSARYQPLKSLRSFDISGVNSTLLYSLSKASMSMYVDDSALYTSATTATEMTSTLSFRMGGKE